MAKTNTSISAKRLTVGALLFSLMLLGSCSTKPEAAQPAKTSDSAAAAGQAQLYQAAFDALVAQGKGTVENYGDPQAFDEEASNSGWRFINKTLRDAYSQQNPQFTVQEVANFQTKDILWDRTFAYNNEAIYGLGCATDNCTKADIRLGVVKHIYQILPAEGQPKVVRSTVDNRVYLNDLLVSDDWIVFADAETNVPVDFQASELMAVNTQFRACPIKQPDCDAPPLQLTDDTSTDDTKFILGGIYKDNMIYTAVDQETVDTDTVKQPSQVYVINLATGEKTKLDSFKCAAYTGYTSSGIPIAFTNDNQVIGSDPNLPRNPPVAYAYNPVKSGDKAQIFQGESYNSVIDHAEVGDTIVWTDYLHGRVNDPRVPPISEMRGVDLLGERRQLTLCQGSNMGIPIPATFARMDCEQKQILVDVRNNASLDLPYLDATHMLDPSVGGGANSQGQFYYATRPTIDSGEWERFTYDFHVLQVRNER